MFYRYWIVRYVPSVIRGEFVNIGLLVGRDGADWAFRHVQHLRRASRLGGDPTAASYWIKELDRRALATANYQLNNGFSHSLFPGESDQIFTEVGVESLRVRLNNLVQFSDASTVVAESAAKAVEMLYDALVEDPDVSSKKQFRTRVSLSLERQLSKALNGSRHLRIDRHSTASMDTGSSRVDLSISGERVEQLTRAWSFNNQNILSIDNEIRSWAYSIERIQRKGGRLLTNKGQEFEVPPTVKFNVIYESPSSPNRQSNLRNARRIWDNLDNVKYYSADEEQRVVSDTLALVGA
ncbi:DUF3037 domain-containing protein [Acaricomes phytoseiuli]|uniref:DUF3037 domain-containing protein n=1 Tax=Acaricomes phytoseiuli TaxID=291968 RepID=UPI002222BE2A|nr:DUF3037 domain-containing protein [Acaricomes phytoseiuli]MCW1250647.1 DUF3037 domain-containing protein [Acaricomes phytoseiuli]